MKISKSIVIKTVVIAILLFFFPVFTTIYILLGLYDVSRNSPLTKDILMKYFFGNGLLTWILSPLNVLTDIITLPFKNKKIYQLNDLPADYRKEIESLIAIITKENVTGELDEKVQRMKRGMIFFKWYGKNIDTSYHIPEFHKNFKYISTIGISVFNKKQSTSAHFGPIRPSLRVLYNINNIEGKESYIEVGDVKNYWSENKLFIFDDTLLHQSFNNSDKIRYCLFVDVLRPSHLPGVLWVIIRVINFFLSSVNNIFYKNWEKIK